MARLTNTDTNGRNMMDAETTPQRTGAQKAALDRIEAIHSKIDALQTRLERIRARRPGRSARVAGCLWHTLAASRRDGGTGGQAPSPTRGRAAVKRSKKLALEAGLLEDEAERRLWDCDEVLTHGDPVIRLHRKALVLRIQRLMKHAARLASGSGLARRLEASLGSVSDASSSSGDETRDEAKTKSTPHDDANATLTDTADSTVDMGEQQQDGEKEPSDEEENRTWKQHSGDARAEKEHVDVGSPRATDEMDADTDALSPKKRRWQLQFEQFDNPRTGGVSLRARLPGVAESGLDITTDARKGTLRVVATSRTHGTADEEFQVGETLDLKRTRARFEDGVLTLDLPPRRRRRRMGYASRSPQGPRYARQPLFGGFGSFPSTSSFWGF